MSYSVKLALAKKLSQALKTNIKQQNVEKLVKGLCLSSQNTGDKMQYSIPVATVQKFCEASSLSDAGDIHISDGHVVFPIIKSDLLLQSLNPTHVKSECRKNLQSKEKVIVEFSSPNIVKPFHIGHFRGTVLGNFVSNLSEYFVSDVVRLNYLGDWGTQFGLIQLGLKEIKSKDNFKKNALDTLYTAYVKANELGKSNPSIQEEASAIFEQLERQTDSTHINDWLDYRNVTVEELKETYERLGVYFDEYHWESQYAAGKISDLLQNIRSLPEVDSIETHLSVPIDNRTVTLLKSNGSSMYLTRDIAAAIDRYKKYDFSKMYYVTDLSQENHFKDLRYILTLLNHTWQDRIEHVRYGKIAGMSSREGQGVFLKDLLDEARDRMFQKQKETKTTRADLNDANVSDTLAISSLIVHHLKTRRMKNSQFSWDECLNTTGDGGVKLQYCHARLTSLLQATQLPATPDLKALEEPIAVQLMLHIGSFHDVLCFAHESCESSVVVKYLFTLCNLTNKALKDLSVKGSGSHLAEQRVLLFSRSKDVLYEGLVLLGIKPLERM